MQRGVLERQTGFKTYTALVSERSEGSKARSLTGVTAQMKIGAGFKPAPISVPSHRSRIKPKLSQKTNQ